MTKVEYSSPPPLFLSQYHPDSSGSTIPFETDIMPAGNTAVGEGYQTASAATIPGPAYSRVGSSDAISIEPSGVHLPITSGGPSRAPAQGEHFSRTTSSEPGLEILGRGMRDMVEVINRLRQVGVEDFVLPLPKIAVVGNQSAGKSSLIEAISGIRVPRSTGTCTRCPLEINLTEGAYAGSQWTCRVSLRYKFFHNPPDIRITESGVLRDVSIYRSSSVNADVRAGSLGPWVERSVTEDIQFQDVFDKDEVEEVLVRAQKAILNPSQDWKRFLPGNSISPLLNDDGEKEDFEVKFSPNIVCMSISGPGLPNLSFVDLPGIIEDTENDSEMYLVPLIKELVRGYIDNKDCLVLLAVPMTDDAENQSGSSIAKKICRDRCIGALTKPDLIQPGEYGKWKKILEGQKHELEHGYFVTKQPPQARLKDGIDNATARREELEFFHTQEPWKTELSNTKDRFGQPLRERFGTLALQNYLSQTLTNLIRRRHAPLLGRYKIDMLTPVFRLPDIKARVTEEAEVVNKDLLNLPEPPATDLVKKLSLKLKDLQRVTERAVQGLDGQNQLNEEWNCAADRFADIVINSFPKLRLPKDTGTPKQTQVEPSQRSTPRTPRTPTPQRSRTKTVQQPICLDSSGDEESSPSHAQTKSKKRPVAPETAPSTPAPKRARKTQESQAPVKYNGKFQMVYYPNPDNSNGVAKVFTLGEIRWECRRVSSNRMLHHLDLAAINHLTQLSIKRWDEPAKRFLDQTGQILRKTLAAAIGEVFHEYRNTALFQEVNSITESFFEEQVEKQFHSIDAFYRQELSLVFATKDLTANKMACLRSLEDEREQARHDEAEPDAHARRQQIEGSATTPQWGARLQKSKNSNTVAARTGDDEFRKELEYLADVRAYYDYAALRFVDNVHANIRIGIFVACRESFPKLLEEKLGIDEPDADERCKRLMVENDDRERRRANLKEKKRMLDKALDELAKLG